MKLSSPQRLVKQALAEHLDGARLSFLAHLILPLFQVGTVNLAEIVQAFAGRVKPASNYRGLQRFFQQSALDYATVARPPMAISSCVPASATRLAALNIYLPFLLSPSAVLEIDLAKLDKGVKPSVLWGGG